MYACMFARILRNEEQKEIVNKHERQNCVIFFSPQNFMTLSLYF